MTALQRDIATSSAIIAVLTAVSRVFGFVRDAVLASLFGTGFAADAFYVAFRVPNLARRLVAEGAFAQAIVPVLAPLVASPAEAKRVVDVAFTRFLIGGGIVALLGILAAEPLVSLMAWGFRDSPEKFSLTVTLTRVVFPYVAMAAVLALFMGILHSMKRFAVPALAPILLNGGIIIGALIFSRITTPVLGLAFGVLLGGLLQLVAHVPLLARLGFRPRFAWFHPKVREMERLLVPAVYGSAVYHLNVFVMTFFASALAEGAVSALWYAGRVLEFPLGVCAVAVATAVLPSLSQCATAGNRHKLERTLLFGLELTLFMTLPAAVGLLLLAEPITVLLFYRGSFGAESVAATARALQGFAIGLPFIGAVRLLAAAYYALKIPRIPVIMATVAVAVNLVACVVLNDMGAAGLALATSLSMAANAVGLLAFSRRYLGPVSLAPLLSPLMKIIVATALMALVLLLLKWVAVHTLFAIVIGVGSYGLFTSHFIRRYWYEHGRTGG